MRILTSVLALVVCGPLQAAVHTEDVEYRHDDTVLRGYLAYDDANPLPRPGVLVVHEWWGLNEHAKNKAERLAEEGYIAFALDMYGEARSTDHPQQASEWSGFIGEHREIGRQRFLAAYEVLRQHPLSLDDQIAAIGYCFGGSVVLSMAMSAAAELQGVVSFHGALPTEPAQAETIGAKFLVCHGAEDPLVSDEQVATFQANLKAAAADWQFITYGGARHSFTAPGAEERGMPALAYNAAADRRSWQAMLLFFDEIFAQ